jgi:thioredoxin reductase
LIELMSMSLRVKSSQSIHFDKVLLAWGSHKRRLNNEFSNVFYLEDRHSHARCHNEILKAKTIVVMGGSFEAY